MYSRNRTWVKLLVIALVIVYALGAVGNVLATKPTYNGTEHGNGRPPDHAKAGGRTDEKTNNDPDDDSHGPDRGDGSVDDEDRNNGCGNEPSGDRTDDNEGWCGKPPTSSPPSGAKPQPPTGGIESKPKAIVVVRRTCKLVLWGETPEVFAAGVDVHDPANELQVIIEGHTYVEKVFPLGFEGTVLWYREATGHTSIAQHFECNAEEVTLFEPLLLGDWME